ncbi:hypothetical protein [Candidatus Nitrosotenuis cloacae]|uniref:hypothetical protein n=1 Tax=Candidatus Nitrosotenuis cloacae TaxID=1603555 RepID=UPI002280DDAA|nr:hypothetical protein [Candidatus Nitrosotenuis cloacae]
MRALCLITIKPGKTDNIMESLKKKRKILKEILPVTGRADICVLLQGTMDEINNMVIDFKKIKEIVSTETLIEVEVNMGW